jgi:hypothetical protein
MSSDQSQSVTITVNDAQRVSGLLQTPPDARACYVLARALYERLASNSGLN